MSDTMLFYNDTFNVTAYWAVVDTPFIDDGLLFDVRIKGYFMLTEKVCASPADIGSVFNSFALSITIILLILKSDNSLL